MTCTHCISMLVLLIATEGHGRAETQVRGARAKFLLPVEKNHNAYVHYNIKKIYIPIQLCTYKNTYIYIYIYIYMKM